ncbi:hypothetical protein GF319_14585 [Candidatus Bathyarchaeota archaeon]|nr:hypothetical protein [Candidatus Bathyarchaeota archaeon]
MSRITSEVKTFFNDIYSEFRDTYYDSGAGLYFGDYLFRMQLSIAIIFLGTILTSVMIHYFFFSFSALRVFLATAGLALTTSSITTLLFMYYPVYKKNADKTKLEDNLVYSLSYMAVLAASGMPIERIMARLVDIEKEDTPIWRLAKRFTTNVRVFGHDVLTALGDISERSPSKSFSNIIYGMRTTIFTSGELDSLLSYEVDRQLQKKREDLKKLLSSLVYIGELYVTAMVVGPVLFILMITILSVIGGGVGGSPVLQLNLITFFGLPVMASAFILLLDMMFGEEE